MLKYRKSPWRNSSQNPTDVLINLPNHSLYPESKIQYEVNLGGGNFTEIQTGSIKNYSGSDKSQRTGLSQSVVIKRLRSMENGFIRQHNEMDFDRASVRNSFHQAWTIIHRATHPNIIRLMGMVNGPTNSIILERAPVSGPTSYAHSFIPLGRQFGLVSQTQVCRLQLGHRRHTRYRFG